MRDNKQALAVIRKIVPPILTLSASAAILGGAYWIHKNQERNASALAIANQTTLNSTSVRASLNEVMPSSNSANGLSNPPKSASSKHTKPTNTSSTPKPSKDSDSSSAKTNNTSGNGESSVTQSDIGFAPVSGGVLKASPSPADLDLSQPFSSIVQQYGSKPQTSFNPQTIQVQDGLTIKLDKSMKASIHQLLVVPLQQGVLWAIIPADTSGTATHGTPLYYTIYGQSSNPHTVVLSTNAQKLGEIPASIPATTNIQTNWYHPSNQQSGSPGNNTTMTPMQNVLVPLQGTGNNTNNTTNSLQPTGSNTTNTGSGGTSSTNTQSTSFSTGTDTSSTSSDGAQIRTISDTSASTMQLFLSGLYRVEGGAIIDLTTESNGNAGSWVYFWNEQKQALLPICSVENTATKRGWVAIGSQTVYWGQRSLIAPAMQYYKGSQHMMDLATKNVYPIKLGSWTDSGFVEAGHDLASQKPDGHTNEDNLYFRVKNSGTWKEFIPSLHK